MNLDLIIQDTEGKEISKTVIEVTRNTSVIVKLLKEVPPNVIKTIADSIERGLNAECLIVPDWAELTFIEIND